MNADRRIVVYRSTFALCVFSTISIASIVGMSVANHRWGGGSTWIDALAAVLGFATLVSISLSVTGNGFRGTKAQAIQYLNSLPD